jgi:HEAT repeat protein
VDALLALLQDTDLLIVGAAAETLADLNEQRAVEPLLRLVRRFSVQSQEWEVIATALARLETPGSAGADYLLAIVKGEEFWSDRGETTIPSAIRAAWMLAGMGDRRVIDALLHRMRMIDPADASDDTFWEWVEIADVLAEVGAVEAVEPLAAALTLAPLRQQEFFANALQGIGDSRAVPALVEALESHHGSYTMSSNDIAVALEHFGTPDALQAVERWERSNPKRPE